MQPQITRFDLHVPVDVRHVAEAADVLGVREFELFRLAHVWWHHREAQKDTLDREFSDYLMKEKVPAWVRHYCRNVLNLDSVDQLNPRDFGVDKPSKDRFTTSEQRYAALITFIAFLIFIFVL